MLRGLNLHASSNPFDANSPHAAGADRIADDPLSTTDFRLTIIWIHFWMMSRSPEMEENQTLLEHFEFLDLSETTIHVFFREKALCSKSGVLLGLEIQKKSWLSWRLCNSVFFLISKNTKKIPLQKIRSKKAVGTGHEFWISRHNKWWAQCSCVDFWISRHNKWWVQCSCLDFWVSRYDKHPNKTIVRIKPHCMPLQVHKILVQNLEWGGGKPFFDRNSV